MAAKWLYSVDDEGVRVTTEFMEKLRQGDSAALRTLFEQKLTFLYLREFTCAPRRLDAHGIFWSGIPETELIPFVKAGRHRLSAWITKDIIAETVKERKNTWSSPKSIKRSRNAVISSASYSRRRIKRGKENVFLKVGKEVVAWNMIPNPKFDLVVVDRYDRAALLKLLSELDSTANVERWLTDRTLRQGATVASTLHDDYKAWCEQHGDTPAGTKNFGQALVVAGVTKLTRSNAAQRYGLELR